ncbi:hypothetical protein HYV57_01355 [Candidatus Peregrinibacteria bacterium]|nr:hypothetical protein [Candidatus Peregrinibacteria bacterium]
MRKIFLAFPGCQVKISEKRKKIGEFEFWNLEKISKREFLNLIKKEIKPFNQNVRKNYFGMGSKDDYEKSYKESTWGILLPNYSKDNSASRYESLFVINLFSDLSLPVMFYVDRDGVTVKKTTLNIHKKSNCYNAKEKFANKKFPQFYELLVSEIKGINWNACEVLEWNREQWRLSLACLLFSELEQYQKSKDVMIWQKECAEIVTLYETLLSRYKNDNGSYKIIQRVEILLGNHYKKDFENIKKNLKILFDYRNEFVHGGFFDRLKKATRSYSDDKGMAQLPKVDCEFLEEQAEVLRKTLIVFIYLKKKFKKIKALKVLSVPEIVNIGIMDIQLRKKIQKYANKILKLTYSK